MGYRRPHYRKDHIRRNSDGSKSYVRDTYVKGHTYNRNPSSYSNYSSYSGSSGITKDTLVGIFLLLASACFILMWLGMLLGWEDAWKYLIGIVVNILLSVFFSKL